MTNNDTPLAPEYQLNVDAHAAQAELIALELAADPAPLEYDAALDWA